MTSLRPLRLRALLAAVVLAMLASGARAEQSALDFSLQPLHADAPLVLSELRGRWVVLNFWATWCPPCIREMPELEAFYQAQRDAGVEVIAIAWEEIEPEALREFVERLEVTFPVARAFDGDLPLFPDLLGLPTTYLIDPDGRIVDTHVGPTTERELRRVLKKQQARRREAQE